MKSIKKIEQFIREAFNIYMLDYDIFFGVYDEEKAEYTHSIPIVIDGKLNMGVVEKVALILGIEKEDIFNMNEAAVWVWREKYDYFSDVIALQEMYERTLYPDQYKYSTMKLFEAITGERHNIKNKYDMSDIMKRLNDIIVETDKNIPGTLHVDAKKRFITYATNNFFECDYIEETLTSFIELVNTAERLFHKAIESELTAQEIKEYNFIVSALGIIGRSYPTDFLFYDNLRRLKKYYMCDNFNNFSSYVKLTHIDTFQPWRCKQFVSDKALVQKYVNVVPTAKKVMREYAMDALNFKIEFVWSDDIKETITMDDVKEAKYERDRNKEFQYISMAENKEYPFEITTIYVPKTSEEAEDANIYAEKLRVLSGPVKLGGVKVPRIQYPKEFDKERFAESVSSEGYLL